VVYSQRQAPTGSIVTRDNLAIRLKDGRAIDTYRLIDAEQIPQVVAAFRRSEGFARAVRAVDGYWYPLTLPSPRRGEGGISARRGSAGAASPGSRQRPRARPRP
jgi:hypothetical protein